MSDNQSEDDSEAGLPTFRPFTRFLILNFWNIYFQVIMRASNVHSLHKVAMIICNMQTMHIMHAFPDVTTITCIEVQGDFQLALPIFSTKKKNMASSFTRASVPQNFYRRFPLLGYISHRGYHSCIKPKSMSPVHFCGWQSFYVPVGKSNLHLCTSV